MKKLYYLFALVALLAINSCNTAEKTAAIKVNQLGYYPNAVKKAIVSNSKAENFEIRKPDGTVVFSGSLSQAAYWKASEEHVKFADFSGLTAPGTYVLAVDDAKASCEFEIRQNLYADALKASLKTYYFIRASMDIDEKYAGKWHRKAGHPDTVCYMHPSANRGEGKISSPGGWYDAGDYNKYVVNAGVTVGTLLNFYEMFPQLAGDNFLNIPESGNGRSDLLDEVKYELDWVLTMQATDGAAHMKLSSKNFTGFIMPHLDDTERYVIGKATAPTLNFAGMMAQASRLYHEYDAAFAQKCLVAAEKAWAWAAKNPDVEYKNPQDIQTGEYGDKDFTQEFWWAAAELFLATKKPTYLDYLTNNEPYVAMEVGGSWAGFIGNLGSFSLILSDVQASNVLRDKIKEMMVVLANNLLEKLDSVPYRIAIDHFVWGSNSDIANSAIIFAYAHHITGEQKYLDAVVETVDYLFGKNATEFSFLTGFGCKTPVDLHNRITGSDGIDEPIPGFVAGGPNQNLDDSKEKTEWGVNYPVKIPAKCYVDLQGSYASNETCINWNAPVVFILGFLEAQAQKLN
jgi:endoglucanase